MDQEITKTTRKTIHHSKQYLKNMLNRDEELAQGWVQIEHPLLRKINKSQDVEAKLLEMPDLTLKKKLAEK